MVNFLFDAPQSGLVGDALFLSEILRYEASLAKAQASVGLIPHAAAQSIVGTCKVELFDVPKIVREGTQGGDLVHALVQSLRETVGIFNQDAARCVHWGGDSRETLQTALALVVRESIAGAMGDVDRLIPVLLHWANLYAADPVLDRVQMRPVAVTSFGSKCVQWLLPLLRSRETLQARTDHALQVHWGGVQAVRAGYTGPVQDIIALMAADLGLGIPALEWRGGADDWLALACEWSLLTSALGRMAADLVCMGQVEVGEVSVRSTMDAGSELLAVRYAVWEACQLAERVTQQAPLRFAALSAASMQGQTMADLQAGMGQWTEWLGSTQRAVAGMAQALDGLQVQTDRMHRNMEAFLATLPRQGGDSAFRKERAEQAAVLVRRTIVPLTAVNP